MLRRQLQANPAAAPELNSPRPITSAAPAPDRACSACAHAELQAPAIVHDVLRGPGQRLDASLRAVFEPRFGQDLGHVRVYAGARANESARAVDAMAYTVGRQIVVPADHYPPRTAFGMALLAHELVHTLQQRGGIASASTGLKIGDPTDNAEREAEAVSAAVMRRRAPPSVGTHPTRLSRWKIDGTIATVDSEQDRLGMLPDKVKSTPGNWICIRPIAMRTAGMSPPPDDFEAHYERYLQIGDTFDLSNLTAQGGGNSLRLNMFLDKEIQAVVSSEQFYPGMKTVSTDPETEMAKQSGEGRTPLSEVILFGHSGGNSLYGDGGSLIPSALQSDLPTPTFSRAQSGRLPHRCWLTTDAEVRAIGCHSDAFADDFVSTFLRGGGHTIIYSTLRGVVVPERPNRKEGDPKYFKAVMFEGELGDPVSRAQDGPFGETATFHASKYWRKTKGWL